MNQSATPHAHDGNDLSSLLGFGASLWWLVVELWSNAPPWQVVPTLMFGAAALWNARTNARRGRKD